MRARFAHSSSTGLMSRRRTKRGKHRCTACTARARPECCSMRVPTPMHRDNEGCTPAKRMPRGSRVHATLLGASTLRSALSGEGDLDATDADGNTALHWAAAFGYVDVIAALLERGAEIDATNGWGRTPLLMAAAAGHGEATIALVDAGADPNVFGRGEFEYSPLHAAAARGQVDVMKALLGAGAGPRAKDRYGNTPLGWAKSRRKSQAVELLAPVTGE